MFESLVHDVTARTGLTETGADDLLRALTARLLHNEEGGFAPLLADLRARGYAETLARWLGDDPKAGLVDPADVEPMLGARFVGDAARTVGTTEDAVRRGAAVALPGLVSALTPGGMIPSAEELEASVGGWAGGRVVVNAPKLGEPPVAGFPTEPAPVELELGRPVGHVTPKNPDGLATLLPWAALLVGLPLLTALTCGIKPREHAEAQADAPKVESPGAAHTGSRGG